MAVGRISGPLLKDNLLRNGVNLAFETNLLYLDVVNSRLGVKTTTPQYDLDVNGTTRSTFLYTTTQADIATFTVTGSTISSTSNTITFTPNGANPTVFSGTINVGTLTISGNTVQATGTNNDVNIAANGTGSINLNSNVLVTGDLHATGNITADGNIQLGNNLAVDTVSFAGEVNSDIIPATNNTYNLGSNVLAWNTVYANNISTSAITTTTFTASDFLTSGLEITGNTISARNSNTNINLTTTGTGGVVIGNFKILNNSITNTVAGSVTQFNENSGYVKFSGTNGIVIPVGTGSNYPSVTETGMMRYNSDQQYVEIYNGSLWTSVAGNSGGVTLATSVSTSITYALLFG